MRKTRPDSGWRGHGYFMETILQSLTAAANFKRRAAFELEPLLICQRRAFSHPPCTSDTYENTNCFWDKEVTSAAPPPTTKTLFFSDIHESIRWRWINGSWSVVRGYNCFDTCHVINNEAATAWTRSGRQTEKKESRLFADIHRWKQQLG